MSSRREEEKNEKIIRGLMKLPPNRKCINCNSMGPQYVCTNFWTFVCTTCSGIHREFTHRVKSVSMAKFTKQEVEALQKGGNQRAREFLLGDWDTQRMRLPDNSNPDKIRAFIKDVYLNKKYVGGKSSDKPPGGMQNLSNHEQAQRRASSYHSFSQSPPYENQYEDRRYGKQIVRRLGSDQGLRERKVSDFVYSQSRLQEQNFEDRFANESSGSRTSDYSISSTGDPFRFDGQLPNPQDSGYSSSPLNQVKDSLHEDSPSQILKNYPGVFVKRDADGFTRPQRTASSSSFGSVDSNFVSLRSVTSGSTVDVVVEPEHSIGAQKVVPSNVPLAPSSTSVQDQKQDTFNLPFMQPPMTSSAQSLDLFSDISNQLSSRNPPDQKPSTVPFSQNEGWARFDLPHHVGRVCETNKGISAVVSPVDVAPKGTEDASMSKHNDSSWFSVQSTMAPVPFLSTGQGNLDSKEWTKPADQTSAHPWNAFGDFVQNAPHTFEVMPRNTFEIPGDLVQIAPQNLIQNSLTSLDPYAGLKDPEGCFKDGFPMAALNNSACSTSLPFNVVTRSSFQPSVLPLAGGATQARKSTNPFDLTYDLDVEANNALLNMRSLQASLPNSQLPAAHLDGLSQPWLHHNSVATFVPSLHHGGLAYMAKQTPSSQLQNLPQQGHFGSLGGNPFA